MIKTRCESVVNKSCPERGRTQSPSYFNLYGDAAEIPLFSLFGDLDIAGFDALRHVCWQFFDGALACSRVRSCHFNGRVSLGFAGFSSSRLLTWGVPGAGVGMGEGVISSEQHVDLV